MGNRDSGYILSGTVDVDDDSFFGGSRESGKRGRGTEKTAVVFDVSFDEKGRCEYMKAKVVPEVDGDVISEFAKENIEPGAIVRSDGFRSSVSFQRDTGMSLSHSTTNKTRII